jgi:hypothetical protein
MGVNERTGQYHVEINGLTAPQSPEATRICKEDLNEVSARRLLNLPQYWRV